MQKFKVADGANTDGTALDRDGFTAGTKYLAKVINDNQWNVFNVVEDAGYTLIDGDLSQLAKALKAPYNPTYIYNTSAIATQTVSDVVKGNDGHYYEVLADGVKAIDPVTDTTGKWKKLPLKVANAVNADEALSKGQLLIEMKAVDGAGSGLDADLLRGLPADFTSSIAANGYQKLPSGLIIQWGTIVGVTDSNANLYVTLPISYPTTYQEIAYGGDTYNGGAVLVGNANIAARTTSGFWVHAPGLVGIQIRVNFITVGY